MKKHIFTLGAAVLLLASCQNNPSQSVNNVVSDTTTMMGAEIGRASCRERV